MAKIGVALGGGGTRGLAHLPFLEVLDEMEVRPHALAGTSIGAVLGVAYAAGKPAAEIREDVLRLAGRASWLPLLGLEFRKGGLLKLERVVEAYLEYVGVERIEDLEIPIRVVAADFWRREEVVFAEGLVRTAVRASMSLPGVFKPVLDDHRVLVDGGCVNPVPYDELDKACDVTIAIDVLGRRSAGPRQVPSLFESIFNTYQIMEKSITREKLERVRPTIYLEPEIEDVAVLDFTSAEEILAQADGMKDAFRRQLEAALED
jgi:NTE family protein